MCVQAALYLHVLYFLKNKMNASRPFTPADRIWCRHALPFLMCGYSNAQQYSPIINTVEKNAFQRLAAAVWAVHIVLVDRGALTLEESRLVVAELETYLVQTLA